MIADSMMIGAFHYLFLATSSAHNHLTALLVTCWQNVGALRVVGQIMTHHKMTFDYFNFHENMFSRILH